MPARFELTIRYWLNASHVLCYVIVAILVSVQSQRCEKGERDGRRERTIKRRESKEGKDARARARLRQSIELIFEECEHNIEEG